MANYNKPAKKNDWITTLNDEFEVVSDRVVLEHMISFVHLHGLGDEFIKFLREQIK